jgi:hypothetical protein
VCWWSLYLGLAAAAIDAQEIALHGSILLNSVHDAVLFVIYGKVIGQTLSHAHAHAHAHALTAPHRTARTARTEHRKGGSCRRTVENGAQSDAHGGSGADQERGIRPSSTATAKPAAAARRGSRRTKASPRARPRRLEPN